MPLLTVIILVPFLVAAALLFVPASLRFAIRLIALSATFLTLLLVALLFLKFQTGLATYQFVHQIPWIDSFDISYHVGVDGINIGLLLITGLIGFCATAVSWEIKTQVKEFYILLLVMLGGILGAFASLDLFFFYFFHELALVPTFIMIGIWGRGPNRNYAAFQITLYLTAGALVALAGLIALYYFSGAHTFDIPKLAAHLQQHPLPSSAQKIIFPLLLFGFGILVSLWPFHTWAPLGYSAAPTATAMLHAGILKKFGVYGLIRIALPLVPQAAHSWAQLIALLCLGNILYCGWVAMRQTDLNFMLGNSSVAHVGFIFLGIASFNLIGLTGAVVIMIAHGLLAALAFGLSGALYQQTRTLQFSELGGLLQRLPFLGGALVLAAMAGCGLPGLANFPGEIMVLFGSWQSLPGFVVFAAWGALIIAAIYMLRAVRAILHGRLLPGCEPCTDATDVWRRLPYVLLIAALLIFGCFPRLLTEKIKPSVQLVVKEGVRD